MYGFAQDALWRARSVMTGGARLAGAGPEDKAHRRFALSKQRRHTNAPEPSDVAKAGDVDGEAAPKLQCGG